MIVLPERALLILSLCLLWASITAARPENLTGERSEGPSVVINPPNAQPGRQPQVQIAGGLPHVEVLPTSVPPVIDGRLDDVCWQYAPVISQFTQVEPDEGALPTERTEVRLLYSADYLYVGIHCLDREPKRIVAAQMQRDANLASDDTIALTFDTFGRKRSGYFFSMNAAGAKVDGLIEPNGRLNTDWDAIWYGSSRIDAEGWTAEIAIPFKSLAFDSHNTVWGLNIEREIRRKQERIRWASPFRNKTVSSLADFGELRNLTSIHKGIGLDVKPFLTARHRDQRDGADNGFDFQPGLDVFYSITPSLTAAVTVNTDFAETEVDDRKVNLTRFPLFFPEKRAFFLQDANLFTFNTGKGPLPFYSRRIGLGSNGQTVDILAGGKLTGRIGNLDVGLLDVQVDQSDDTPSKNLSVARLSYRVLEESSIGTIFTHGDPSGDADNWLAGTDLTYRNSHVFGNNIFEARGWIMKSNSTGSDDRQMAFGGTLQYPNDPFWIEAFASQIDEGFNPALGFVSRQGIREYSAYTRYRLRPSGSVIRTVDVELTPDIVTNLDDVVETEYWGVPSILLVDQRGDSLRAGFAAHRENFFSDFEIHPGVVIAAGDYRFNRAFGSLSTTSARPVSAFLSVESGGFYNGRSDQYIVGAEWRISPRLFLGSQCEQDRIDLPAGSFDVIVSSLRANITFSPTLSWNNVGQYDNVSKALGVYSNLKWIIKPGNEVFLVFKNGFDTEDGRLKTFATEVATKLVWTLRF